MHFGKHTTGFDFAQSVLAFLTHSCAVKLMWTEASLGHKAGFAPIKMYCRSQGFLMRIMQGLSQITRDSGETTEVPLHLGLETQLCSPY